MRSSMATGRGTPTLPSSHRLTAERETPIAWAWASAALRATSRQGVRRASVQLDRIVAAVAGADADRLLDRNDENLAVADASGARGILDRLNDIVDEAVLDHHLDLHLGQEVDHIFGA